MDTGVITALVVAGLLIGATGTWSPCGFSMIETIGPTGHTGGQPTTLAACATFFPGAVAGAVFTFGGISLLGAAIPGEAGWLSYTIAGVVALLAAIAEARGRRIAPQIRRQLPEHWRRIMPMPVAAALYGILLGLGFTTFVLTFGVWALAGISLALGEPAAGVTWRFVDNAAAYFGYSEANRAPSPAELSCADPLLPCTLGAFFLADPPLKQVVSRTFEAGLRGSFGTERLGLDGRLRWNLGLFRTGLEHDILLVQSEIQGRGFFQNAGDTRRQGLEAGLSWRNDRVALGLDYALIDATFRTAQRLPSPNNPLADEDGAIPVERGDRIPGIPRHRLRFDAEWRPIQPWAVGGNVAFNSGQYLRGDESNQLGKIDGYARVNLRTSLRVGPGVELYGLVRNLFDKRYATFGTLYDLGTAESLGLGLSDPRTVTPGLPRTFFGGVRVVF